MKLAKKGQLGFIILGIILLIIIFAVLPSLVSIIQSGTATVQLDPSTPIETRVFLYVLPLVLVFIAIFFIWRSRQ